MAPRREVNPARRSVHGPSRGASRVSVSRSRKGSGAGPGGRRTVAGRYLFDFIHRHASGFLIFKIFTIITAHKNPGSLDKTASIPYSVTTMRRINKVISPIGRRHWSPSLLTMVIIIIIINHF